MKILIVDDSTFMRTILKGIIAQSKYAEASVIEATDGNDAVAKFNSEKPDLVLLDIVMPNKDGIAVLKDIGHQATSIVIVSSNDQPGVIEEAKSLGAKDYIIKPYDSSQVITMLDNILTGTADGPSAV
jgi:two-component system chemotaxis response regulator CheY